MSELARQYWEKTGGDDPLKGASSFQEYFDLLPDNHKVLEITNRKLGCMDDGLDCGIRMAGSGILNSHANSDLKDKGIEGVTSHEGCGAVGLYIAQNHLENVDPNELADQKAKELAQELGVPFVGRIPLSEMKRPADLHIARAVYYTGVNFDPTRVEGLLPGYVIGRNYMSDPSYALTEVKVAYDISTGDHGYGSLFTSKTPLYFVAVSTPENSLSLDQLTKELQSIAGDYENVKVESLLIK